MDSNNSSIFTNYTKQICMYFFISLILIILFIISPLHNFYKTSIIARILALASLSYAIYLNNIQTNILRQTNTSNKSPEIQSQINMNIISSYVFTLFLGLLAIFVVKSFI